MRKLRRSKDIEAARVAQMYYMGEEPMNQGQIARELNLNKATISRLLRHAHDHGIVRTTLNLPRENLLELDLKRKHNLHEAVVLPVLPVKGKADQWRFRRLLAAGAARHLEGAEGPLKSEQCVGVSCGRTMHDLVQELTPRSFSNMTISQLAVETESEEFIDISPFCICGMLAAQWSSEDGNATAYSVQPLPGTMRSERKWTKEYGEAWDRIMKMTAELDVAILGIGTCEDGSAGGSFTRILEKHKVPVEKLRSLGVVGEICNRPYTKTGEDVTGRIDKQYGIGDYVDGVELEALRALVLKSRSVVAIAGGKARAQAIDVALRNRFVNYLITDTETAEILIDRY